MDADGNVLNPNGHPLEPAIRIPRNVTEVILNEEESVVYEDINMKKWGVFENYFKAGNYLQTTDPSSHATVKYYALEVSH